MPPEAGPNGPEAEEQPKEEDDAEEEEGEDDEEEKEGHEATDAPPAPPCAAAPAAPGATVVFLGDLAADPGPLPGEPAIAPLRHRAVAPALPKQASGLFQYAAPDAGVQDEEEQHKEEDQEETQEVAAAVAAPTAWGPDRPALRAAVAEAVPAKVLRLAREILAQGKYIGHSAFVLFGLCYNVRPMIWEGENKVDLIEVYAPAFQHTAVAPCAVDGVACVLRPRTDWCTMNDLMPVGEQFGLRHVNHWVAAVLHSGGADPAEAADPLNRFYQQRDRFVIGTVCDGDCGIDVMTQMLERAQNEETRTQLRRELYDYLMRRHQEPWLHDILVATQELEADELQAYRDAEGDREDAFFEEPGAPGGAGAGAGGVAQTAVAVSAPPPRTRSPEFWRRCSGPAESPTAAC